MGYFTLTLTKENQSSDYLLFHAPYLNEAWLAIINDDGTTKIIKEFKCKKFEHCFQEASKLIRSFGEVKKITVNDTEEHHLEMLLKALEEPAITNLEPSIMLAFSTQNIRNWFSQSFPKFTFAN